MTQQSNQSTGGGPCCCSADGVGGWCKGTWTCARLAWTWGVAWQLLRKQPIQLAAAIRLHDMSIFILNPIVLSWPISGAQSVHQTCLTHVVNRRTPSGMYFLPNGSGAAAERFRRTLSVSNCCV